VIRPSPADPVQIQVGCEMCDLRCGILNPSKNIYSHITYPTSIAQSFDFA